MRPDARSRCPHCGTVVKFTALYPAGSTHTKVRLNTRAQVAELTWLECPACQRPIINLAVATTDKATEGPPVRGPESINRVVWPSSQAPFVPPEVPDHIKKDYLEAAETLPISPNASAALSRRCLQAVLREAGGADAFKLSTQIDQVRGQLPSQVAESLDYVREVGNLAAHPQKDEGSGQIVNAERGEADVNLHVLATLFDEFYVKPARHEARRKELNKKLAATGRRPIGEDGDLPGAEEEEGDTSGDANGSGSTT